jgi:hypothetical protein
MRLSAILLALAAAGETVGFIGARVITWHRDAYRGGGSFGPFRAVRLRNGVHIHHLVPGLMLALAAGLFAIVSVDEITRGVAAALAGLGAGIVLDETALLVYMDGAAYWDRRGKLSVRVGVVVTGVLWLLAILVWATAAR